jgi:aprataxin
MDIDDAPQGKGEETKEKPVVVILVGAPGSGKSTFSEQVMSSSKRPWVRICQVCVYHVFDEMLDGFPVHN